MCNSLGTEHSYTLIKIRINNEFWINKNRKFYYLTPQGDFYNHKVSKNK